MSYALARDGAWDVAAGDSSWSVQVIEWGDADGEMDLQVDGWRLRAHVAVEADHVDVDSALGATSLVHEPRFPDATAEDVTGGLLAPMPGSVLAVHVEAGATVGAGDLLLVLEAMKMEHRVTAPADGVVAEVRVAAGDPVATDDVLVILEGPSA